MYALITCYSSSDYDLTASIRWANSFCLSTSFLSYLLKFLCRASIFSKLFSTLLLRTLKLSVILLLISTLARTSFSSKCCVVALTTTPISLLVLRMRHYILPIWEERIFRRSLIRPLRSQVWMSWARIASHRHWHKSLIGNGILFQDCKLSMYVIGCSSIYLIILCSYSILSATGSILLQDSTVMLESRLNASFNSCSFFVKVKWPSIRVFYLSTAFEPGNYFGDLLSSSDFSVSNAAWSSS